MANTLADEVRKHCREHHNLPAREREDLVIALRSGDIHSELKLKNRLPLICACLGSKIFENENNIERIAINGPLNGSTTLFVFKL